MTAFLQQLDFVSPEGLWDPALSGNELEDYAYGYQCAEKFFRAFIAFLQEQGALTDEEDKCLKAFASSTIVKTPDGKGFGAFVDRMKTIIEREWSERHAS